MNNLLREHVSSSLVVTRNIVDAKPQDVVDASVAARMANAGDIATAVGTVYSDEAKEQITGMFVDRIKESNKYAAAVAAGDEEAKKMAVAELKEYVNDISGLFGEAINDLPKDDVYVLLEKHETLLNDSIDAYKVSKANFLAFADDRPVVMQEIALGMSGHYDDFLNRLSSITQASAREKFLHTQKHYGVV